MFVIFFILFASLMIIIIARKKNAPQYRTQADVENRLAEMISNNFEEIGWNNWGSRIHHNKEQLKRLERAVKSKDMVVLKYDKNLGTARVLGDTNKTYQVSGRGCTCEDFEHRKLPCKHMYFLAITASEEIEREQEVLH